MTSGPTARSLAWCREQGWLAIKLERWNPHARVLQDALGFADMQACIPGVGVTMIQVCTVTDMARRQNKIQGPCWEKAQRWLAYPGNQIEVWGWAKRGPRGKRKLWSLKRRRLGQAPDQSWHWLEISEDSPADLALTEQEP